MFPFTTLQKINCFHATICTGGQGLHPAHNDTVYEQIPREQCTDEGLHCSASSCFPSSLQHQARLVGRVCTAWSAQEPLPQAPASSLPPSASKHWPQRSARAAGSRKARVITCASSTENKPTLGSQDLIRVCLAESSFSALATPELAAKPWQTHSFQGNGAGCAVPAAALLASLCRLQWGGCTQLCQSVPTSQLPGADRQMTCYIFPYF